MAASKVVGSPRISNLGQAICSLHKICPTRSEPCRTVLIRNVLKNPNPGAFNEGSNVEIRRLGADLVTFEVATRALNDEEFCGEISVN